MATQIKLIEITETASKWGALAPEKKRAANFILLTVSIVSILAALAIVLASTHQFYVTDLVNYKTVIIIGGISEVACFWIGGPTLGYRFEDSIETSMLKTFKCLRTRAYDDLTKSPECFHLPNGLKSLVSVGLLTSEEGDKMSSLLDQAAQCRATIRRLSKWNGSTHKLSEATSQLEALEEEWRQIKADLTIKQLNAGE